MPIVTSRWFRTLLVLVTGVAIPLPALAAWPNSAFTGLPVCVAANDQQLCTSVSDGAGGAILVWEDGRFGEWDIFGEHVLASGVLDPAWPALGLSICTNGFNKLDPIAISDGAGGVIVAWIDGRNTANGWDIYAQHALASGVLDPAWPASGVALCALAGDQVYPVLAPDGAGGAIAAWQDNRPSASGADDIYAHHVQANGVLDPIWPVNGLAICTAAGQQSTPRTTSDGNGGAIITWADRRSGTNYDIYATHVFQTGVVDVAYPANGLAVCNAAGDQQWPGIVSDGDQGALITWYDRRNGSDYNIYAQHVVAGGTADPGWLGNGVVLSASAGDDEFPVIASDGLGGAYVAWMNLGLAANWKVLVQHVLPTGALDSGWPANGLAASGAAGDQKNPMIVADGLGGAFIAWQDVRAVTNWDIYGQHVITGVGLDATFWSTYGKAISIAAGNQFSEGTFGPPYCSLASDGAGGLIAAWHDFRASGSSDIYAERIARFGYIGSPEAEIVSVHDVPNDNGGEVKLSWNASYLDQGSDPNLAAYDVLRSVPQAAALARLRDGTRLVNRLMDMEHTGTQQLLVTHVNAQNYYWEYLASVNALHYVSGYSYLAPTTGDSIGTGNPRTAFMVVARNVNGAIYWPSRPDSGYSVDNLAPATPAPFTNVYASGASHLRWGANTESDLAGYRLYRGYDPQFVPGPGNLIAAQGGTDFIDVGASGTWYKLSAVDVHGNVSGFAVVGSTTTDVGGTIPTVLDFAPAAPNPAAGSTTLRFGLPRAGRVGLAIFDASGRQVRTLVSGVEPAGEHEIAWDLRDDAGHAVTVGLYLARLEVGSRLLSRRLTVLR